MPFQSLSLAQGGLRKRAVALAWAMVVAAMNLLAVSPIYAQAFTWGGAGSSSTTVDYSLGTNWSTTTAGAPPVTSGQSAIFDAAGSITVSVTAGAVAPDAWTFNTAAQSYIISGGAVNFSLAGASGGIIDNASSGQTISIANNIGQSVAGVQVQQLGNGTLQLSGNNSYSGGTIISGGGTLRVTNSGSVGTGVVTLDNGQFQGAGAAILNFSNSFRINNTPFGSAIDANGQSLTISGNITDGNGPGALTIVNSRPSRGGGVLLTGTNTYTGGTTICSCGTLQLGSPNQTGSIVGAVTNEGRFDIINANTAGITSITNDNGLIEIFNANTFAMPTITNQNGGAIFFVDQSNAGSATIVNGSGTAMFFYDSSSAMNADITVRSGGELVFNSTATAANATITTNDGGSTLFNDNSTGGNAQFITNGTGLVDFSGSLGPNGDGRITVGSIAGSGSYFIGAGNTLVVGSNNLSTEVSGVIADSCGCGPGSGSLEKIGTGTLTLSGANSYSGTTTVIGGVLDVEGSIAASSLTTVNAGGALTGAGMVGNTVIASGGILLPGNGTPGSSLNVAGNLALQSGALYLVQLNSVSSTFANVTGTAALAGAVGASFAPGSTVMKQYIILTAGGHSGGFDGAAVIGSSGGLVGTLSYDPAHVYINFSLYYGAPSGLNVNQKNVGTTLTNFFNANGGIPLAFTTLGPAGLAQASGETATGTQQATFDAMNLFLGLLSDPFIDGRGAGPTGAASPTAFAGQGDGASAFAESNPNAARDAFARLPTKADVARNNPLDPRWSLWGAAYGGGANIDGNAASGSNAATARVFGLVAGADYRISPDLLTGFALAGGGTNFAVSGFGSGRSDLFQAGAFLRQNIGAAYLTAMLAYGWQDVTTDRTVTIAGIDRLHAEFNANAWSGRLEAGNRFATPWIGVTPYAAGQFTTYQLPAYGEQALVGTNTFAINYAAKDVTELRSDLGVRTDRSFALPNAVLSLRGRAAWAHDFDTARNVTALFQALPGASFVVNGAAQAHDLALTSASAEMKWTNGFSLAASFEGEFSGISRSYAGKGVARYAW